MLKKILYIFYCFIKYVDKFFYFLTRKSVLSNLKDFIHQDSNKSLIILNQNIHFFVPNQMTEWRVDTFFSKEPETLDWIDKFNLKEKIIFWDVGANIGLYSLYAGIKHKNIDIVSFETSSSNLRVLSRNISLNKLQDKIKIFQIALTNKENKFLYMREPNFIEGGALNSFGETFDFEGKDFTSKMSYKIFGTTINYLLKNNILKIPNYIKIDVDGIEHLILEGGSHFLNNSKIKSISVEINENFKDQYKNTMKIMKENNFELIQKKHNTDLDNEESKFKNTYNFIFKKK